MAIDRVPDFRRYVKVTFPDPEPGTWPADADFRDEWEGRVGIVLHDNVVSSEHGDPGVMVRFPPGDTVEVFRANELTRVCGECGHDLDPVTGCTWAYCPTT